MSNKHWVTTVLESSQLSQMPNWSLEVLHNAKQHSLKLGGKKTRSYKMQKCTKMHFRRSSVAFPKWRRWIIRTLRRPLAGEITRCRKWAPKHTHDPKLFGPNIMLRWRTYALEKADEVEWKANKMRFSDAETYCEAFRWVQSYVSRQFA